MKLGLLVRKKPEGKKLFGNILTFCGTLTRNPWSNASKYLMLNLRAISEYDLSAVGNITEHNWTLM